MIIDQDRIEKALVEVQAGNREAFREVVQQTSGLLRAFVNFHVHNDDVASDVLQDVYVTIFRQVGRYQPGTNCVAWIKSVARYTALTARKSYVRERGHIARCQLEAQDQLGAVLAEQDREAPLEDRIVALHECLKQLTERARTIVERHYFKGQALEIVAATLGMTVNAVGVALHRTRQLLARCVETKGEPA